MLHPGQPENGKTETSRRDWTTVGQDVGSLTSLNSRSQRQKRVASNPTWKRQNAHMCQTGRDTLSHMSEHECQVVRDYRCFATHGSKRSDPPDDHIPRHQQGQMTASRVGRYATLCNGMTFYCMRIACTKVNREGETCETDKIVFPAVSRLTVRMQAYAKHIKMQCVYTRYISRTLPRRPL